MRERTLTASSWRYIRVCAMVSAGFCGVSWVWMLCWKETQIGGPDDGSEEALGAAWDRVETSRAWGRVAWEAHRVGNVKASRAQRAAGETASMAGRLGKLSRPARIPRRRRE